MKHLTILSVLILALALTLGPGSTPADAQPADAPADAGDTFWQRFAERFDADGDGTVTLDEFRSGHDERFARHDRDGDGVLTADDFEGFAPRARHRHRFGRRGGGMILFGADADRSGDVTRGEWLTFLAELDADADGVVSDEELSAHREARMAELGITPPEPPPAPRAPRAPGLRGLDQDGDGTLETSELQAVFDRLDADGDGMVSEAEMPSRRPGRRGRGFGGPPSEL